MPKARILGTGAYLPERVVTNDELAKTFDTSDEWIRERSGIRERRYCAEHETGAFMGAAAARGAAEDAAIDVGEIDYVICATLSPDTLFPGNSVYVGSELGLAGVAALDVRTQCTGFLYSLDIADKLVASGQYRRVLVVGSEIHSTSLRFSDEGRDVTVLFGDAAAAAIVGPADGSPDGPGVLGTVLHADGRYAKELWCDGPGSAHHPRIEVGRPIPEEQVYPRMNGRTVFKFAVGYMPKVVREVLDRAGKALDDVDIFVFHQANLRIVEAVQKQLELPPEKVFNNIEKRGNTTAASIPLALHEAREAGRVQEGSLVCMAAFGSGFTWGATLVRF